MKTIKSRLLLFFILFLLIASVIPNSPFFIPNVKAVPVYGTFGVTTTGGSGADINDLRYYVAIPGYSGKVTTLTAYLSASWPVHVKVKAALYQWVSDTNVGSRLATCAEQAWTGSGDPASRTFTFNTSYNVVAGTKYFIALWSNSTGVATYWIAGTYGGGHANLTYASWPDSITTEIPYGPARDFDAYVTYNRIPTQSTPGPADSSTGIHLTPKLNITVADIDVDSMKVTFASNYSDGTTWVNYQTNTTTNATCKYSFTGATVNSHKYYWTAYVNDGATNISSTYSFTTESAGYSWTNRAPTFSSPSPTNGSTVTRWHATNITVSDLDGNASLVCFWYSTTAISGPWTKAQQNVSLIPANTTAKDINASYASSYSTNYWWKVTAYDGHTNSSKIYNFTTVATTPPGPYSGPDFYVNGTSGNNGNNGSLNNPWKTIEYGISQTHSGDTLRVMAGIYTPISPGNLVLSGKNTVGSWYILKNYNNDKVIIDGTNCPTTEFYSIINIATCKYVRISGLILNHSKNGGIWINGPCDHIIIDNCTISNSSCFAIKLLPTGGGANNITFEYNYLYNDFNDWSAITMGQETISFESVTDFSIDHNRLINNRAENIDMKGTCKRGSVCYNIINTTGGYLRKGGEDYWGGPGVMIDSRGKCDNISIYNNNIYGNGTGIELEDEGASGHFEYIYVYNNIINMTKRGYSTDVGGGCGLIICKPGSTSEVFHHIFIYNNFIKTNVITSEPACFAVFQVGHAVSTQFTTSNLKNVYIVNNIFTTTDTGSRLLFRMHGITWTQGLSIFTINNNSFYSSTTTMKVHWGTTDYTYAYPSTNIIYFGGEAVFRDPKFITNSDYSANFHIPLNSPLRNVGSNILSSTIDYDMISRPQQGAYDIGPYEYNGNLTGYPGLGSFNCNNEYYSFTTPITLSNVTLESNWVQFNCIGFNITFGGTSLWNNISSITTYPRSDTGWIINWTQQKTVWAATSDYSINGLKASYTYTLYSNGSGTDHTTSAAGVLTFSSAVASTNRLYALWDAGIPAIWYVATAGGGGSDANSGTILSPLATLQKAINKSSTGDTIIMRGGTYTPSHTTFVNRSGTVGDYYLITNYSGETVIIDGTNAHHTDYANATIELKHCHYVRITGINLNHSYLGGITVRATPDVSSYIRMDNCTISNCSSFAFKSISGNSYIYCENNYIYNNFNNWSAHALSQETISYSGNSYGYIYGNTLWKNHCEQIDMKSGCTWMYCYNNIINTTASKTIKASGTYYGGVGIYVDCIGTSEKNISIYSNLIYGNNTAIQISNEAATGHLENITIYNNIINVTNETGGKHAVQGRVGILVAREGGSTEINKDIKIYMNTVNNGLNVIHAGFQVGASADHMDKNYIRRLNISNNIFTRNNKTTASFGYYQVTIYGLNSTDGSTYIKFNNNLYNNSFAASTMRIKWEDGDYTRSSSTKWGNSPIFTKPLYVSPAAFDFHLNASSPCVGAATSSLVSSTDYDGITRPYGGTYEVGAYEYTGLLTPSFIVYGENPGSGTTNIILNAPLEITIHESHGYKFNYTIRTNATAPVWYIQKQGNNKNNGTFILASYTNASACSKMYWWKVTVVNGTTWSNATYHYTTLLSSFSFTGVSPMDGSLGTTLTPTVSVTIQETHGCKFNYTIRENKSVPGTWTILTSANDANNGTYSHVYHPATAYSTKYWWKVTALNGTTYHNATYCFTTTAPAIPIITFSGLAPPDESTGIIFDPDVNVTINESHGYLFNYSIQENTSIPGTWTPIVFGNNTGNLTVSNPYTEADHWSHTYYWRIISWNGTLPTYHNATYHFMTLPMPTPVFIFSSVDPANMATGVTLAPDTGLYISETHGYKFNFTFRENSTGSWTTRFSGNDYNNATLGIGYALANTYSTKYWWRVYAVNGTTTHTETYCFTTLAAPGPPGIPCLNDDDANWTTSTSVNLSWVKGGNTTNTYVNRSTTGYLSGDILLYTGTNAYYNNTLLNPAIRYFYTLTPYNSVTTTYGSPLNVSLVETDNATSYGSSWIDFKGYMMTDKNMQVRFQYSDDPSFGTVNVNLTVNETGLSNKTTSYDSDIYSGHWLGQVFKTGSVRYYPFNVTLKLKRYGSPGLIYCQIYSANTSTWFPSGAVLAQGSKNANSISTTVYEWFNISLSNYHLLTNTRYCIVISSAGSSSNRGEWARYTSDGYSYGQAFYTNDGGASYHNQTGQDMLFKIWGHQPTTYPSGSNTTNETIATTGVFSITKDNLNPGVLYYYRARGNDSNGNHTQGNVRFSLTKPDVPIFVNMTPSFTNSSLYVNWLKGNGANRTVLVNGGSSYPSTPADGVILYNGTGTSTWLHNISFNTTYRISLFSFTVWGSLSRFSGGATIPWGGISFNCYNESSGLPIGYSVLVSDKLGEHVYFGPDLYGFTFINITEIPLGGQIGFYVTNNSTASYHYNPRMYYYNLTGSVFFNLSFYLVPTIYVPDVHNSSLYSLHVVETVSAGDYQYDSDVGDVNVTIKRYVILSDSFVTVASMLTDDAGYCSVYLLPNTFYKVFLSKEHYVSGESDYIPAPPNQWGQTEIKLFRIIAETSTTPPEALEKTFWNYCTFTGVMNQNDTIYMTYIDLLSNTTDAQFYLYEEYNGTLILKNTTSTIDDFLYYWFGLLNHSRVHKIRLSLNQTDFGWVNITIIVNPYTTPSDDRRHWIEDTSSDVFGSFEPGYVNFFIIFASCLACLLIPGHKNIEVGIVLTGLILGLISVKITLPWQLLALIPFIVFIGILFAVVKHGKVKL
jgi:hypothetical protein